jgi:hypothetical protein
MGEGASAFKLTCSALSHILTKYKINRSTRKRGVYFWLVFPDLMQVDCADLKIKFIQAAGQRNRSLD